MKAFVAVLAVLALAGTAAAQDLDVDILQFALQAEYLEAEFYSCAATGKPLASNLRGGGPASTGCTKADLGADVQALATEIANNEIAHVTLLREALGSEATPIPLINIGTAFNDAADAAFGETLPSPFNPYLNDLFFLIGAYIFEDVGVTAYQGAVPLITNVTYLQTAAAIEAVEAYHAGIIRANLFNNAMLETPYNVTVAEIAGAISKLRDNVGGVTTNDVGIETSSGSAALIPADSNALIYGRTPAEVLKIVYLGGTNSGGFLPNGANGYFKSAAASS